MSAESPSNARPSGRSLSGICATATLLWLAVGAICTAILITDIHRLPRRETGDFEHFFYAADAVRHGFDPYAAWTRGYIYPPLIAFVGQPIAALGYDRAAAVMLCVNVAVTLLAITLAASDFLRRFNAPRRDAAAVATVVLLGLLLNLDKVKGEWQMWQTDVWMLLLFVLGLRWLDRRPMWAGFALGIGANIKYLPLLLLPYLLIRRRWTAAASLVIASVTFAMLPAVSTGWSANGRNWATALHGLTGMAGGSTGTERAEVHGIADSLSCSVTSALARAAGPTWALPLAGSVAGIAFVGAMLVYRRWRIPIFQSPAAPPRVLQIPENSEDPRRSRWALIVAVEWPVLVAVLLAFSPQTNTRHLFDAVLLTTAAAVLLTTPGVRRWPLIVGVTVLVLGFNLPPGHRTVQGFWSPTVAWLRMGGPCWCLLIAAGTLLWTGLARASAAGDAGIESARAVDAENRSSRRP